MPWWTVTWLALLTLAIVFTAVGVGGLWLSLRGSLNVQVVGRVGELERAVGELTMDLRALEQETRDNHRQVIDVTERIYKQVRDELRTHRKEVRLALTAAGALMPEPTESGDGD